MTWQDSKNHHAGERHRTKSIRHADTILHTTSVLHCQHQQPAVPTGYGGNRRFLPSSVISMDYRTPVNYEGIYAQAYALLNGGYQYWYEGGRDRRTEPAQRNAPHERSGGGESAGIFPETGTRRHLREVDARSSHTQQDCHLRKDTGEQAGDTDIGTVAGEIQIPHEKETRREAPNMKWWTCRMMR